MSTNRRIRIPIDKLKVGMVLAEDVLNNSGLMLIPKNTVISQKHLFRLNLYQILSVVIKEISPDQENLSIKQEKETIKVSTNFHQSFEKFSETYYIQEKRLQKQINKISSGQPINMHELLAISKTLINSLKTHSDLFNYLYHLRSDDQYTYTHCLNVSMLCNILGHWLHMPETQINNLTIAGLLHDIGKIKIDNSILNKSDKLTIEEIGIIKQHTLLGYQMIKNQNIHKDIKYGILMHHEKLDGSGYPNGLKDEDIHDFAKIIAISDIYDAMTSDRSYHKKFSPFKVISIFEKESYGLLEPDYLFVFLENIAHNYLGKSVRLSTEEIAKIVFIHRTSPSRPIVQVNNGMINLLQEPSITIDEIL